MQSTVKVYEAGGGGFLVQRSYQGRAVEMGPKLSEASWYKDDPFSMHNLVKEWVIFSKFYEILVKICQILLICLKAEQFWKIM